MRGSIHIIIIIIVIIIVINIVIIKYKILIWHSGVAQLMVEISPSKEMNLVPITGTWPCSKYEDIKSDLPWLRALLNYPKNK
jgi:hypothetical protein